MQLIEWKDKPLYYEKNKVALFLECPLYKMKSAYCELIKKRGRVVIFYKNFHILQKNQRLISNIQFD